MKILFTGLTGAVGSVLALLLQKFGYEVWCLVRNGQQRATAAGGSLFGIPAEKIINGDIILPNCGISVEDFKMLKGLGIEKIIHSAASIKFANVEAGQIWMANVVGTQEIISLANKLKVNEFVFVSTIFACQSASNPYEGTKYLAEGLVKESGIPHKIIRIPIVVGDSITGASNGFDGFYGFFKGFFRMMQRGRSEFSVCVEYGKGVKLNMAPINWVVEMMTHIIALPAAGRTHVLIHPNPPAVQWVMRQGFKTLGIQGVVLKKHGSYKNNRKTILQRAVDKALAIYMPYVCKESDFASNLQTTLGEAYKRPPKIDYKLIKLLLDYAVEHNFGDKEALKKEAI